MGILGTIAGVIAHPAPSRRAAGLLDALLWRGLLGLSILFLVIACWRLLEKAVGPILAPLTMALALSITAAALAYAEARRRRRIREEPAPIAPLVATVLEIAFAPKLIRWFALGSLLYDHFITGKGPLAPRSRPERPRRA